MHRHGRLLGISSLLSARFSALTLRALGRGSKCSTGPGGWTTWPGYCLEQLLGLVCYLYPFVPGKYGDEILGVVSGHSVMFWVRWLPLMVILWKDYYHIDDGSDDIR